MGKLAAAWRVVRRQGLLPFAQRAASAVSPNFFVPPSALRTEDALGADPSTPIPAVTSPAVVTAESLTVAWVMSPPVASSGGHQNIVRFIRVLEEAGHRVRIYLYSATGFYSPKDARAVFDASTHFSSFAATIENYPVEGLPAETDVIIASNWPTVYRTARDESPARRVYFVQDFEPSFYPASSEAILAENTYRFGYFGITAGRWLATKLARDYGMPTVHYDFGSDLSNYPFTNDGERGEVLFYARPSTPRRGFELGVLALELFHRDRPEVDINLVGQKLKGFSIPFPHTAPGSLVLSELAALYNRCRAGLVISLTNLSLLPLELLSAGVIPVLGEGENNRMVSDNPFIEYAELSPRSLANRLIDVVDRADAVAHAKQASASVGESSWSVSAVQFLAAFDRGVRGR